MTKLGPADRAMLPLRAFLGVTFCFAGLQKLANRAFFNAANPASIQGQLAAAGRSSPIHALISPLQHVAVAVGLLIALSELAVGLGTLLGLWSRIAAAGGMVLALMLFLTVSFHSSPYYTGADIVFLFAFTPLLLAPPSPWSADAIITAKAAADVETAQREKAQREKAQRERAQRDRTRRDRPRQPDTSPRELDQTRRETVLKAGVTAAVAVAGFVIGGLTSAIGRLASGGTSKAGGTSLLPSGSPTAGSAGSAGPSAAGSSSAGSGASGRAVGPAGNVPVGSAASFTDPVSGDPALVLHPQGDTFLAFDAVCPHAGCTVQYDPGAKMIVCPCHGSEFNATSGAVILGPSPSGLRPIPIHRGPGDQLYVT